MTSVILDGAFLTARAAFPHLERSGEGAIVNLGGMAAHTGAKGRPHVIAAKAGLVGLTRALAHDFAAAKVTVNCVSPGIIATVRVPSDEVAFHGLKNVPQVFRVWPIRCLGILQT